METITFKFGNKTATIHYSEEQISIAVDGFTLSGRDNFIQLDADVNTETGEMDVLLSSCTNLADAYFDKTLGEFTPRLDSLSSLRTELHNNLDSLFIMIMMFGEVHIEEVKSVKEVKDFLMKNKELNFFYNNSFTIIGYKLTPNDENAYINKDKDFTSEMLEIAKYYLKH